MPPSIPASPASNMAFIITQLINLSYHAQLHLLYCQNEKLITHSTHEFYHSIQTTYQALKNNALPTSAVQDIYAIACLPTFIRPQSLSDIHDCCTDVFYHITDLQDYFNSCKHNSTKQVDLLNHQQRSLFIALVCINQSTRPLQLEPLNDYTAYYLEVLGKGAFGTIRAPSQKRVLSNAAFKLIDFLDENAQEIEDIFSEINLLNALFDINHPWKTNDNPNQHAHHLLTKNTQIVSLSFYIGSTSFSVYQLLLSQGKNSFHELLRSKGHTLITFFSSLFQGLSFLHEIINANHGDIKPEQILLDPSGQPKLCDFGASSYFSASHYRIASTLHFRTTSLQQVTSHTTRQIYKTNHHPKHTQRLLINEDYWALLLSFIIFKRLTASDIEISIPSHHVYTGVFDMKTSLLIRNRAITLNQNTMLKNFILFNLIILNNRSQNEIDTCFFSTEPETRFTKFDWTAFFQDFSHFSTPSRAY